MFYLVKTSKLGGARITIGRLRWFHVIPVLALSALVYFVL